MRSKGLSEMSFSKSFVPGHISGFFQVCDRDEDVRRVGSRNCGPCIGMGVETSVRAERNSENEVEIFIDGERSSADTSRKAVLGVLEHAGVSASVEVRHSVQAPISAGYGMSGAGALGSVLALSAELELGLRKEEIVTIAHEAEVECQSGLGDVGPEYLGGLVIGLEPGSPPFGKWGRIGLESRFKIVCATLGKLSTSDLLNNSEFRERVARLGKSAMRDLLKEKSLRRFMNLSKEFSLSLGIYDEDFEELLEDISREAPLGAGAVLLGRSIFAPSLESEVDKLIDVFRDYFDPREMMVTSLRERGAETYT